MNHFLRRIGFESDIRSLTYHVLRACKYINFSIRAGHTGYAETENASGEDQLKLDVLSDQIILKQLERSELCALAVSEEQEHPVQFASPRGAFTVAYDPLDGSSLFDANLSIGSIFGIWEGDEILGQTGQDLVAAIYVVYGPQVTAVISAKGLGTHSFEMNDVGEFMLSRENIAIAETSKYFAPGNLRACNTNAKYKALVDEYIATGRTLRYSGGMVPDLHHILSKGSGIFAYPADAKNTNGKLRLSFECMPMALIFSEAGGAACDTSGHDILDKTIVEAHERCPILIGSRVDVAEAVTALAA